MRSVVRKNCPQGQVPPPSRGRWQTCTAHTSVTHGARTIVDHHETHHEIGHQFDHASHNSQHLPKTGGRHATPTLVAIPTAFSSSPAVIVTVVVICVLILIAV